MTKNVPVPAICAGAVIWLASMSGAVAQDVHRFDLPEQQADSGIAAFAMQAERQILAPGEDLYGLKTKALHGTYKTKEGLAELLKGTPLKVLSDNGKVIVLVHDAAAAPSSPDDAPASAGADEPETIIVTGYRASLTSAAEAKRHAISFTDAIFAEDMGKFPDTNIAESINRIPGILLTRDANGEGVQVAIRGLSTDFTKILLNNAPIMVAGGGIIDSSNSNREVDLNVFPGELFTQVNVTKTARAELVEGGAAGTVNLRTRRPFDNPGAHLSYTIQGITNSLTNGMGGNGAVIVSDTWQTGTLFGDIGILTGFAGQHSYQYTDGWEDGNAGWLTPTMTTATLCGTSAGCDIAGSTTSIGGDGITLPVTIPSNVTVPGYPAGSEVNAQMLRVLNPGLTTSQIANMLLPRLPRDMYERGARDRINAALSLEIRPAERLRFYFDSTFSRQFRRMDRSNMSLGIRTGNGAQPILPANTVLDGNGVVQTATLYNAQFDLEARDYKERFDFLSLNPGLAWMPNDLFSLELQFNTSRSHYFRETPAIFVVTAPSNGNPSGLPGAVPLSGGVVAYFDSTGSVPAIRTNIDLNDPANFQWYGGRASLQLDRRFTISYGSHLDLSYGGETLRLKLGGAYDVSYRSIVGIDETGAWQSKVCQNGSNGACAGKSNSLIPQSALAQYLYRGPDGFVAVDFDRFKAASQYDYYMHLGNDTTAGLCAYQTSGGGFSPSTAAGATSGCFEERATGAYAQADGIAGLFGHDLRYNIGLRWAGTRQEIRSPVKLSNNDYEFSTAARHYDALLPSLNLSYELEDGLLLRAGLSRTMTRANISQMIQTVNFSDFAAESATLGTPTLKPYYSRNIDLGFDYYTGHEGYFSLAFFRKDITGFSVSQIVSRPFSYLAQFDITWDTISSIQRAALQTRAGCTSDADCNATIYVTQQINAPGIETINGLELTYVQPLDRLFDDTRLKGFGFTGNATMIGQSSSGSAAVHAKGVAPYSINLTGYYEDATVMLRLSYTFHDRTYGTSSNFNGVCLPSIQAAASGCAEGAYLFSAPYGQADFSSSLRLSEIAGHLPSDPQLTLNVQNVFNARQVSYFQYPDATSRSYHTGQTLMIGLHGAL